MNHKKTPVPLIIFNKRQAVLLLSGIDVVDGRNCEEKTRTLTIGSSVIDLSGAIRKKQKGMNV